MTADDIAADAAIIAQARERWDDMPPVVMAMGRLDGYLLMCAVQLALSYTGHTTETAAQLEQLGRGLQAAVCDDPEVFLIAERGWGRTCPHKEKAPGSAQTPEPPVKGQ